MRRINGRIPAINRSFLAKSQIALIMCKPDAMFRELAPNLIKDLSGKLDGKVTAFRIVAPKIFQMPRPLAEIFYDNVKTYGTEIFNAVIKYATGTHPDKRVPQGPMMAFILEAIPKEGEDLIKILRSDDMIGPTNINAQTLASDPARANEIMKSLRYKYTLGMGVVQKPFKGAPGMNIIHCSSDDLGAKKEIGLVYKKTELSAYYDPDALRSIYASLTGAGKQAQSKMLSLPLRTIANTPAGHMSRLSPHFDQYRDFDATKFRNIRNAAREISEMAEKSEREFFAALVPSSKVKDKKPDILPPPSKKIIGISGIHGSGKTEVIKRLVRESGFKKIILVTTRPPRTNESEGKDYRFVSERDFLEKLDKRRFAAVEQGDGIYYGILKEDIEAAMKNGDDLVFAGGKNTVNDIREYISDSKAANYRFLSVFINVPGKNRDEVISLLQARFKERGSIEEQLKAVSFGYDDPLKPFSDDYGLVVTNEQGKLDATVSAIKDHIKDIDKTPAPKNVKDETIVKHWNKISAGIPLKMLLAKIVQSQKDTTGKSLQEIEDASEEFFNEMCGFFARIKGLPSEGPKNQEDTSDIAPLAAHTNSVLASLFQLSGDFSKVMGSKRRIGALSLAGDPARHKMNYDKIMEVFKSISMGSKIYIAVLHDIGKLIEVLNHHKQSYDLVKLLSLQRCSLEGSKEDISMDNLTIAYHTVIGSSFLGTNSYAEFLYMFSDPEVRALLCDGDGKVNMPAFNKLFARLLYITVVDTAGSWNETGALNNTKLETYFRVKDWITGIFQSNARSYDEALKAFEADIPKDNKRRIGLIFGYADKNMDSKKDPIQGYLAHVEKRALKASENGAFSRNEWESAVNDLHFIMTSPYGLLNYLARVNPEKNIIEKGWSADFSDGVLKLLIVLSKILGKQPLRYTELHFVDSKGKNIVTRERSRIVAVQAIKMLDAASIKTVIKGGKIFMTRNDGSIMSGIEITTGEINTGYFKTALITVKISAD
jgi:guanylate kinase